MAEWLKFKRKNANTAAYGRYEYSIRGHPSEWNIPMQGLFDGKLVEQPQGGDSKKARTLVVNPHPKYKKAVQRA